MEILHANLVEILNDHRTTIHQLSVSYLVARLLTIFFKRRFSFKVHTRKDVLKVLPVFLASFVADFEYSPQLRVLALICSNALHCKDEMVKTICIWLSIYTAAYANLSESTFACLALGFATTQFLRKPDKLKNFLREPRVVCGPVYVIFACTGLRFCAQNEIKTASVSVIAAMCSALAAVLFRPDNKETLRLFLPEDQIPTTIKRQVIHGVLLFVSFLATFGKLLLLQNSPFIFKAGVGFGILNMALFLSYKFKMFFR